MNVEIQQWLNAPAGWRESKHGFVSGLALFIKFGNLISWKGMFTKNVM